MSRLRSNRDSDSQVKSECSHLIRDSLTLYLGFWGYGACSSRKKNRKLRSSKLLEKHWVFGGTGRAPLEKKIEN